MYDTAFSRASGTPVALDASENAASRVDVESVAAQDTGVSADCWSVAPAARAAGATDSRSAADTPDTVARRSEDITDVTPSRVPEWGLRPE